jgi:tetratricopeptide (TPR) repeat protein
MFALPPAIIRCTKVFARRAAATVFMSISVPSAVAASSSTTTPLASAWRDTALGLSKDALPVFQATAGPEARFGEALTLLLRQPKTSGNIEQAESILRLLADAQPDSDLGIASRYYLARIAQIHRQRPDPSIAHEILQALVSDHPKHPIAQQALVKLALLDLYTAMPAAEHRALLDTYANQVVTLSDAVSKRDLHLLLADTAQRFGYPPQLALHHLVAAEALGLARRVEQANTWIRIGLLAADLDQPELARRFFERFLATFNRDNRRLMIQERLSSLPTSPGASQ